jgi:hypothetical protein
MLEDAAHTLLVISLVLVTEAALNLSGARIEMIRRAVIAVAILALIETGLNELPVQIFHS